MAELGGPLVEDTLPPDFPDDQCMKLTLRNKDGKVENVKCRKFVEVISDPDHDLIRKWMGEHGPGKEGHIPRCKEGDFSKRHADADFPVFRGGWDKEPTHAEYHGFEERVIDPRFYGGSYRR